MTALYGIWHRPSGLTKIANRIKFRTQVLMDEFDKLEIKYLNDPVNFFDTVSIDCRASGFSSADFLLAEFHKFGINLRKIDDFTAGLSFNETTTIQDCADLIEIFALLKEESAKYGSYLSSTYFENLVLRDYPENLRREGPFMQQ
jgi:glycine dehydrogenase